MQSLAYKCPNVVFCPPNSRLLPWQNPSYGPAWREWSSRMWTTDWLGCNSVEEITLLITLVSIIFRLPWPSMLQSCRQNALGRLWSLVFSAADTPLRLRSVITWSVNAEGLVLLSFVLSVLPKRLLWLECIRRTSRSGWPTYGAQAKRRTSVSAPTVAGETIIVKLRKLLRFDVLLLK
jgi:hypothetical protein